MAMLIDRSFVIMAGLIQLHRTPYGARRCRMIYGRAIESCKAIQWHGRFFFLLLLLLLLKRLDGSEDSFSISMRTWSARSVAGLGGGWS